MTAAQDNSREAVDLDPRVQIATLKERLDPTAAIAERVAEARRQAGGAR